MGKIAQVLPRVLLSYVSPCQYDTKNVLYHLHFNIILSRRTNDKTHNTQTQQNSLNTGGKWTDITSHYVHFYKFQTYSQCMVYIRPVKSGPGSSVGIVTDYGLDGSGSKNPVGTRFPPVQTSSGAHPASFKMGTGYFPGVKCGRDVLLTTHTFQCRGHGKLDLYLYPPLGHPGPVTGSLYLYLY